VRNEAHGGAMGFPEGVAYWSKALAVETEKVVQRKREEMMQAELEVYGTCHRVQAQGEAVRHVRGMSGEMREAPDLCQVG